MRLTFCKEREQEEILGEIESRFGIPSRAFEGKVLVVKGKREVWVACGESMETGLDGCVRTGIPLLRWTTKGFRLTSAAVRAFGALATKGVVEIPGDQRELADRFARGEDIPISSRRGFLGQVIVRWRGQPLKLCEKSPRL